VKGFLNVLFDFCGGGFCGITALFALFCLDTTLPGPFMELPLPLRLHGW
jgi:hypothetical protein